MPHVTTADGATIAYDSTGDDADAPLVLVQGLGAQLVGWPAGFTRLLADRGFRVVRLDNRDVGQSQRYPDGGYLVSDMAADVVSLLDALGIDAAHVVGQSMGGMIAQQVAIDSPARVLSLGLLYTAANDRWFVGGEEITDRIDSFPGPTREDFVAWYPVSEAACASPGYDQDVDWLRDLAGQMFDRGFDMAGVARQLECVLASPDRSADLPTVTAPTVVLAGDGDRLIDHAASHDLHGLVDGSVLHVYPGMGHELPPVLWSDIIDRLVVNTARATGAGALTPVTADAR